VYLFIVYSKTTKGRKRKNILCCTAELPFKKKQNVCLPSFHGASIPYCVAAAFPFGPVVLFASVTAKAPNFEQRKNLAPFIFKISSSSGLSVYKKLAKPSFQIPSSS
jgi:hypothetical protein